MRVYLKVYEGLEGFMRVYLRVYEGLFEGL